MKKTYLIRNFILALLSMAIIIGGLFFDAHETLELSENYDYIAQSSSETTCLPLRAHLMIKASDSCIISASEVRDVRVVSEVLKRIENNSSSKRIVILSLIICLLISEGAFYTSVLPSIYPWTSFISSRYSIMCYIHNQDGAK